MKLIDHVILSSIIHFFFTLNYFIDFAVIDAAQPLADALLSLAKETPTVYIIQELALR